MFTDNITLVGKEYSYTIRRSKRAKYIRLQVSKDGKIELVLPYNVSLKQGINFVERQKNWLSKKVESIGQKLKKFRYLGNDIKLNIKSDLFITEPEFHLEGSNLFVRHSCRLSERELFENWIFEEANKYIPARTKELAAKYGFSFNSVKVKKIKTRWGSCSSKRNLSFNCKLMYFNTKVIDYVIIHELCHLVEMNHSKKFWTLVSKIMPDYLQLRSMLNQ